MDYLIKAGIAASRLKSAGMGKTNFIASNRTKSGHAQNRHVEIEFSYPEAG
ncbi:MAG: hypothetical protein KAT58_07135 [candidate division Zixibacteria bacterium]|nr:hypothetical protein [candidate division Zixibacteria bacterium]